ncbi:TonB-dependent receptor domain-containing protein [Kordiimonas aquimaris]|uniref:TonB-dependent receptor domain-containing protein n=1 Tax=Kordiimonas aquimaris TaxID=707591 RepID=UPI0021D1E788|nr:TonB-dependent receptor [Kordiimonas aquimaris]
MAHTDEFKRKLRLGTACALLGAVGVAGVNPAIAQDADADDELAVEEVVVTGSRIKRTGFDTVNPATVVDSEFLELRSFNNVATALNELPSFGIPGASENGGQAGQNVGQNFVNAFGLGSQRTLTLVNGRRVVSQSSVSITGTGVAGSGIQVDLNTIPTALIDRVETVYTGGAPIYGSDAIAGTVNVILKDDFEGFNVDAEYGIAGEGDAENYRFRTLVGGNFADGRGNVVVSMEYARQDGLLTSARPYLATGAGFVNNEANGGAGDGIADLRFSTDTNGVFQVLESGVPLAEGSLFHQLGAGDTGLLFSGGRDADGNGIGVPLIFGLGGGLVDAAVANIGVRPTDTAGRNSIFFSQGSNAINNPYVLSTNEANTLVSPLERYTFTQLSHYDLTDNIRWFSEAAYSRSESTDEINQPSWSTNFFSPGVSGLLQLNVADNPFVTDEIRDILTLNNGGVTPETLNITRTNTDIQEGNENRRSQDSFRFVTGFEGDFEAFGRSWNWDLSYSYGETNAVTSNANINGLRYALAIDAVVDPTTGRAACRSTVEGRDFQPGGVRVPGDDNDVANCIPINIIGYNQFGQDVRDYLIQNNLSTLELQQSVIEGSIAGELFDLPAGPVGFAVGATHRRERGRFDVDQGLQLGIDPTAPVGAVAGGFDTDEVYAEALIPIVSNGEGLGDAVGSLINNFDIEGAVRYVDNSAAGGDYTWTLGGRLNLNLPGIGDAFTFRGNYTEAIRSPAITELFAPQVQTFNFAQDPCENRFIGNGPNPAVRRANCEAQFASLAGSLDPAVDFGTYVSVITNASQPGFTGGNPNLRNEQSVAYTLGFVFEPEFVPGLTISSDYTNIEVTDVIQSLTATQVANACYDSNNFPNEASCAQFTRNATSFQLENFITGQVNAARRRLEAIITDASYTFDLADVSSALDGTMNLTANYFFLLKSDLQVGSADLDVLDRERNHLRHRWQVNASYQLDRFSALLQWRHESGGRFSNEDSDDRRDIFRFADFNTYNATLRYQINDTFAARVVVNNIFDNLGNETRLAAAGGNNINFSDFQGRRFIFGINASF